MTSDKPQEMTEAELARFYEEHQDDMSLWEKKPRQIRSRRGAGPSTIFSLRLTGEELTKIARAAQARDVTVSDFIRRATMAAVENNTLPEESTALDEIREKVRELAETVNRLSQR